MSAGQMIWMKLPLWPRLLLFNPVVSMLFQTGLLCYDAASSFGANVPKMEDYKIEERETCLYVM